MTLLCKSVYTIVAYILQNYILQRSRAGLYVKIYIFLLHKLI